MMKRNTAAATTASIRSLVRRWVSTSNGRRRAPVSCTWRPSGARSSAKMSSQKLCLPALVREFTVYSTRALRGRVQVVRGPGEAHQDVMAGPLGVGLVDKGDAALGLGGQPQGHRRGHLGVPGQGLAAGGRGRQPGGQLQMAGLAGHQGPPRFAPGARLPGWGRASLGARRTGRRSGRRPRAGQRESPGTLPTGFGGTASWQAAPRGGRGLTRPTRALTGRCRVRLVNPVVKWRIGRPSLIPRPGD